MALSLANDVCGFVTSYLLGPMCRAPSTVLSHRSLGPGQILQSLLQSISCVTQPGLDDTCPLLRAGDREQPRVLSSEPQGLEEVLGCHLWLSTPEVVTGIQTPARKPCHRVQAGSISSAKVQSPVIWVQVGRPLPRPRRADQALVPG